MVILSLSLALGISARLEGLVPFLFAVLSTHPHTVLSRGEGITLFQFVLRIFCAHIILH